MAKDQPQRPPEIDAAEIKRRFQFHTATDDQRAELEAVRTAFTNLATTLLGLPDSREKSLAFTHLEQAQFFANASLVRPPKETA